MPSAESTTTPLALVVDDVPRERTLARTVIADHLGWRTREAGTGDEALAALADEAPAVVLTDLSMPDCDGLTLVQSIRDSHPFIPVVLLTEPGSEQIALKALQQGAAS